MALKKDRSSFGTVDVIKAPCGLPTTWEQPIEFDRPTSEPGAPPSTGSHSDDDSTSAGCSSDREGALETPLRAGGRCSSSSGSSLPDVDATYEREGEGTARPPQTILRANAPAFCPPPPGLSLLPSSPSPGYEVASLCVGPPPGLEHCRRSPDFDPAYFHKDVVATFHDLSFDRNVGKAVRRVRAHNVPKEHQAAEVTDILARAAEETRGPIRRSFFAFAAGLGAATPSCFGQAECLEGVRVFFQDVYKGVCEESPRFPTICMGELVPTLYSVFPARDLNVVLPPEMQTQIDDSAPAERHSAVVPLAPEMPAPPPGLPVRERQERRQLSAEVPPAFEPAAFHKDIVAMLHDLSFDRDVGKAVRRVRSHRVPRARQAAEYTDILARAAEERRGPIRRSFFAFVAGLAAATPPAFGQAECLLGVEAFFKEVYPDICEELPRFPAVAQSELVPTLVLVLPAAELAAVLPTGIRIM